MQNNYYLLRQICHKLNQYSGAELILCCSQEKNELVLGFIFKNKDLFIKADLNSSFCCLSFPTHFHRKRKNSIDLFPQLIGKKINTTFPIENDRSFIIQFDGLNQLLFKMHGRNSNIIHYKDKKPTLFKKNVEEDLNITPSSLAKHITQSYEVFEYKNGNFRELYPTLGKITAHYLTLNGYDESLPIEQKWEIIQKTIKKLENPDYYQFLFQNKPTFSLLPFKDARPLGNNPLEALTSFYYHYKHQEALNQLKSQALKQLKKIKTNATNYLEKASTKLVQMKEETKYEHLADILMANLHRIKPHQKEIELTNFYINEPIKIKLKPTLSATQNAEMLYKKGKNKNIEIEKLTKNCLNKELIISRTNIQIDTLEEIDSLKQLKQYLQEIQLDQTQGKTNQKTPLPYYEFIFDGYKIWVGKSAKHNETLTHTLAHKDDLWLHARDTSGSHVLIKNKNNTPIPKYVIEKAAQLAAWFSKRKNENLCPVIYTPKKYVRRAKGNKIGTVIIEKENVILVKPQKDLDS